MDKYIYVKLPALVLKGKRLLENQAFIAWVFIAALGGITSCDKRTFKTEERPARPQTQIRFINLSDEKITVRIVPENGTDQKLAPISLALDSSMNSDYIEVAAPNVLQRIELFKQDGTRVPFDGPLDMVERNDPRLRQDTSVFAFLPNTVHGFYILPQEARKAIIQAGRLNKNYGIAFQVIREEVEEAFPQKAKVRFMNFTSSRGRGKSINGRIFDYDSQVPLPNVITPRMYSCNPTRIDEQTSEFTTNSECEFKTFSDPVTIVTALNKLVFPNNLFTGSLKEAMRTYSKYELMNDGLQNIYLVLGEVDAAVATFRYPLNLKSGGVYSAVLTGEVDFSKPGQNYGLTLRLYQEGLNLPPTVVAPLPGGSNAYIRFINVSPAPATQILLNVNLPVKVSLGSYNGIVEAGFYNIRALGAQPIPVFYETNTDLQAGKYYTLYGAPTISSNVIDGWIVEDDRIAAPQGKAKLQFVNLAFASGPIDMKIRGIDGQVLAAGIAFKQRSEIIDLQIIDEISGTEISQSLYFTKAGTNESIFLPDPFTQVVRPIVPELKSGEVVTVLLQGSTDPIYGIPMVRFIK